MSAVPRTKKGQATRARVLEASSVVFARDGYVEARMLDVAAEAGVSNGALYRYFENKTEVFAALVANLHEEFFELSGHTEHSLEHEPLEALTEANRGYIEHYYANRDVLRALVEAGSVDERFRKILWDMRQRHVERFARAMRRIHQVDDVAGVSIETVTEALACMVEQCCYVWFAQASLGSSVSVDDAVTTTSLIWHNALFPDRSLTAPAGAG
jgi:AcrR family transcriptional regulator